MARSVFYRVKSGPGAWNRATGTVPFDITGLTNGTTYEFDVGDGTLTDVTPQGSFTQTDVIIDGSYLETNSPFADSASFTFFFSGKPRQVQRHTFISNQSTLIMFSIWDDRIQIWTQSNTNTNIQLTTATFTQTIGETIHILASGSESGGTLTVKCSYWQPGTGWVNATDATGGGTLFRWTSFATLPVRVFERSNITPFITPARVDLARMVMWNNVNVDPTSASVQANFMSGAAIEDPNTARVAYGTPQFDFYGPASNFNPSGSSGGTMAALTLVGNPTDA